jgi:tRNA pseudouridine38-40 synthase
VPYLLLSVAYSGSFFYGYQKQKGKQTIQGALESAISRIEESPIKVKAGSRTDRFTHASMQMVTCQVKKDLPVERWVKGINHLLPEGIFAQWGSFLPTPFHPKRDIGEKTYRYLFYFSPTPHPFLTERAYWFPGSRLRFSDGETYTKLLQGEHNFAGAVSRRRKEKGKTILTLRETAFFPAGPFWVFELKGKTFLTHEVRILAGTLLKVLTGKISPEEGIRAMEKGERWRLGPTLPAWALYLTQVEIVRNDFISPWPTPRPEPFPVPFLP